MKLANLRPFEGCVNDESSSLALVSVSFSALNTKRCRLPALIDLLYNLVTLPTTVTCLLYHRIEVLITKITQMRSASVFYSRKWLVRLRRDCRSSDADSVVG